MEPRLSLVTLGVADLALARAFYEGLGWTRRVQGAEGVAFYQLGPLALSLYPRTDLAADAGVPAEGSGFRGFSLAHNVGSRAEVDIVVARAAAAGGAVVAPPSEKSWGGYSGYVADPDGTLWEIAWNPLFPLDASGSLTLPG